MKTRAQKNEECGSGATRKVAEMLKFPRKEEEKKEKEMERRDRKAREEGREGKRKKEGR